MYLISSIIHLGDEACSNGFVEGLKPNMQMHKKNRDIQVANRFCFLIPSMSMDPIQPHNMLYEDIIQRILALLYQWRCSSSLKGFQSHMAVSVNTHILL